MHLCIYVCFFMNYLYEYLLIYPMSFLFPRARYYSVTLPGVFGSTIFLRLFLIAITFGLDGDGRVGISRDVYFHSALLTSFIFRISVFLFIITTTVTFDVTVSAAAPGSRVCAILTLALTAFCFVLPVFHDTDLFTTCAIF